MTMPPATAGKVPILETVREAFAFIARDWRGILPIALIGAAVLTPLQVWQQSAGVQGDVGGVLMASVCAGLVNVPFLAAYLRRTASRGEVALTLRAGADELNLGGATVSVAFLGFIIVMIGAMLIGMALAALLVRSGVDANSFSNLPPQESAAALGKALGADGLVVFFGLIALLAGFMLWITARLILAYPATVVENRMLVFSTWAWTKGHALAIVACLVMVMLAAVVLTWIAGLPVGLLLGMVFGAETLAVPGTPANWAFAFVSGFFANMFYMPAYAGMAAYLYGGLRPSA